MRWLQKNPDLTSVLLLGIAGYLLFLSWSFFPVACIIFCLGLILEAYFLLGLFRISESPAGKMQRVCIIGFVLLALSHSVGIFLPEVGFDALWYHLPLAQIYTSLHRVPFIPELYQSAAPRLGSLLYTIPYSFLGIFGVKLCVFCITLLLPRMVYRVARIFLPPNLALFTALVFFSFHVVAWQASSAYVDQLRAVFELSMLATIASARKKEVWPSVFAGMFLGFAFSTKLLTLAFIPVMFIYLFLEPKVYTRITLTIAFFMVAPWYFQTWVWTGKPLYALHETTQDVAQISAISVTKRIEWFTAQLLKIPFVSVLATTQQESPTTPLFLFAFPALIYGFKDMWQKHRALLTYALLSMMIWILIPPRSVRYALSGFAIFLVISVYALYCQRRRFKMIYRLILCVGALGILANMAIRVGAHVKAIPYLQGKQTQEAYTAQYAVGSAEGPFHKWYDGYWKNYRLSY